MTKMTLIAQGDIDITTIDQVTVQDLVSVHSPSDGYDLLCIANYTSSDLVQSPTLSMIDENGANQPVPYVGATIPELNTIVDLDAYNYPKSLHKHILITAIGNNPTTQIGELHYKIWQVSETGQIRPINFVNDEVNATVTITDLNANPISTVADGQPFLIVIVTSGVGYQIFLKCERISDSATLFTISPDIIPDNATTAFQVTQYDNVTWTLTD
jgi:hypothetical protein